ncbi:PLP-dependent aminotransferase family protein [Nitrincola tibetensis]|uniref:PLP-dependent aminotransferase family protein n=1 Tax=Nitrincola tibetensis TaxID=2219697 RepID=A0A364NPE5_9GAMM|nr:PLP-dependent aminotransferase family protein [Nitrincola tibetensis]RAU18892.1 PLP-dependent aminotransferase family protein [Nitrincola tibetensis]
MFKHSQFESVKAALMHPDYAKYPLYLRIQRALRQLILDGELPANHPLPASRALAVSLNVSRDTVENAYSLLHAEGYIERQVGSGSFVAEVPLLHKPKRKTTGRPVDQASIQLSKRGQKIFNNEGVRETLTPRPFAPGIPETRLFPLSLWARLERQVIRDYQFKALQHSDPQGTKELRRAIAHYVNIERGAHATPERILILTSSQQAIALCAQVLLDEGDNIFTENPLYQGARKAFNTAGLTSIPIPVDQQGMRVDLLKQHPSSAKVISLTPSHQYPTGATLSLERRLELIEWAEQNQAWIIEDDYDSEFHYAGKPTACVQGLDAYQRTIYIGTFTKSLFPSVRIGYMILPMQLVAPMTTARTLQDGHTATISQLTLARFIENGHFGAYIRQMRQIYAKRLITLEQLVRTHLKNFIEPMPPLGGMQMPCVLIDRVSEDVIIEQAKQQGITLISLSSLYIGTPKQAGFLLGFAAYTEREMELAIQVIRKIFIENTG